MRLLSCLLFLFGTQALFSQSISTWHPEGGLLNTSTAPTEFYSLDTDNINFLGSYTMGTDPVVWGHTINTLTNDTVDFEILVTAYDIYNGADRGFFVDTTSAVAFNTANNSMDLNTYFFNDLTNNITVQFNFFEYGTRTNVAFSAGTGGTPKRNNLGITAPNYTHSISRLITTELYTINNINSAAPLAYFEEDSCLQLDPGTIGIDTVRFLNEGIDATWMADQETASAYPFNLGTDKVFIHTMEVENICEVDGDNKLSPGESTYDILFGAVNSVSITRRDLKKSTGTTSGVRSSIGFYIDSLVFLEAIPILDIDDDDDGIPDIDEASGNYPDGDEDGDGIPNYKDTTDDGTGDGSTTDYGDTNSDGIPDVYDTDGDGIPNHLDLDSDNDGIPDIVEAGGTDIDGNGISDNVDATTGVISNDTDGDGLDDAYDGNNGGTAIANADTDGDGYKDAYDLDADNDGIPDVVEAGGVDSDGNGFLDAINVDATLSLDADGDGFADYFDPDDDGTFGIDTGEETNPLVLTDGSANMIDGSTSASIDTDGDGHPDHLDLDADNDGIPDLVEAGGIDTNGDGRVDIASDVDNDGYADIYDTDDDGTAGVEDTNDALLQTGGTDTGSDGKADSATTFINGNNESADHDGDSFPDHLDLDADDDGIPDLVEVGGTAQANGKVDTGALPWDADGDGLADIYDENASDGPAANGTNGTSLVKTTADTNSDGLVNAVTDSLIAGGNNIVHADTDTNPNHLDLDSDNDGLTDVVENASGDVTTDHTGGTLDGIVGDNAAVTDTNDDGWHDPSTNATTDTDGDGIYDFLDRDADNDGIPDYLEGVCSTCPTFTAPSGTDSDGDGVLDIYEVLTSTNTGGGTNTGATPNEDADDGTSPFDYLDTDTDEDGGLDWVEGYDIDKDGEAFDDISIMADNYETTTSNGYYDTSLDSDSDGLPDFMDNQPSIAGYNASARPPFLDSSSPFWHDDNSDGLVDIFDTSQGGTLSPTPDNDGLDDRDWRDMSTLVALPLDLNRFEGFSKQCNVHLEWETSGEKSFSHFELERSTDGIDFSKIAVINGAGGDFSHEYNYKDDNPQKENYYRLKMVDLDRSIEYSKVILVEKDCPDLPMEVKIYPNPSSRFTNDLNIVVESESSDVTISIFDNLGRNLLIMQRNISGSSVSLDVSELGSGLFLVIVDDGTHQETLKYLRTE